MRHVILRIKKFFENSRTNKEEGLEMITVLAWIAVYFLIRYTLSDIPEKSVGFLFCLFMILFYCIMFGVASAFIMGEFAEKEMAIIEIKSLQIIETTETSPVYLKTKCSATSKFIVFKKENSKGTEELELYNKNIKIIQDSKDGEAFIVVHDLVFKNELATLFCFGNWKDHRIYEFHIPPTKK